MFSYNPGDVIDQQHYTYIRDAWIHPDGTMYYVDNCGHHHAAKKFGFLSASECERAGYLHLSFGSFVTGRDIVPRPSEKQIETVLLYCTATEKEPPAWAVYEYEVVEGEYSMSSKYKIGLTRKQRDTLYPNSGD